MLTSVSLFSGIGGLDFGLEAAGFSVVAAVERDKAACNAIRAHRRWNVIQSDIEHVGATELWQHRRGRTPTIDLLAGGPPCQPFSKSGYWVTGDAQRLKDPRAKTLFEYTRVLRELRPRAFLMENVSGFAFDGKSEGLDWFRREVAAINRDVGTNYQPSWAILNAADYGAPQRRERIFIIGNIEGVPFRFPKPTFGPRSANLRPYRTAWDAIGDLEATHDFSLHVRGKWADLLPSIPEGANYLWHTERGGGVPLFGWRTRYWSFLLKLARNEPSWTIQAQPGSATGPFHWTNRRLSAKEMGRLQTFPADIDFDGPLGEAQRLIGNAVPSVLGELLGFEIRHQYFGARKRSSLRLVPERRPVPPALPKTAPVPAKYLSLVGAHPAHPGTGKGPLSQRLAAE